MNAEEIIARNLKAWLRGAALPELVVLLDGIGAELFERRLPGATDVLRASHSLTLARAAEQVTRYREPIHSEDCSPPVK